MLCPCNLFGLVHDALKSSGIYGVVDHTADTRDL